MTLHPFRFRFCLRTQTEKVKRSMSRSGLWDFNWSDFWYWPTYLKVILCKWKSNVKGKNIKTHIVLFNQLIYWQFKTYYIFNDIVMPNIFQKLYYLVIIILVTRFKTKYFLWNIVDHWLAVADTRSLMDPICLTRNCSRLSADLAMVEKGWPPGL